jgi:hypothetical protein
MVGVRAQLMAIEQSIDSIFTTIPGATLEPVIIVLMVNMVESCLHIFPTQDSNLFLVYMIVRVGHKRWM